MPTSLLVVEDGIGFMCVGCVDELHALVGVGCVACTVGCVAVELHALTKATASIVVLARHDCVDGFGVIPGGDARSLVHVVAETWIEPHAVHRGLLLANRDAVP